jgi:hypothetical protein
MMNIFIKTLFAASFLGLISCNKPQEKKKKQRIEDIYKPVHTAKQISEDLEFAYKQMEPELIEDVFTEWQKTVKSNTTEFINQNETISAIYIVFNTLYKPNDLLKIGNWACINDINLNCKYVVIQNQLLYTIVNSNNINEIELINSRKELISNFRPPINTEFKNVLYLTDEYEESINDFLGIESTGIEAGGIMKPSGTQGKNNKKCELLRSYIPVLHDYWGRNWHFETYPYVNRIIFNKSITKAKIDFYVGFQSGEATLQKVGKSWIIKESKINETH